MLMLSYIIMKPHGFKLPLSNKCMLIQLLACCGGHALIPNPYCNLNDKRILRSGKGHFEENTLKNFMVKFF